MLRPAARRTPIFDFDLGADSVWIALAVTAAGALLLRLLWELWPG